MEIIPAILEADFDRIKQKVELMRDHAPWVQLDLGDTAFAKKTFQDGEKLKPLDNDNPKFAIHMMVDEPWKSWKAWHDGGGDRFYFHYSAFTSVPTNTRESAVNNLINNIKEAGAEVGIALMLDQPLHVLEPYLEKLDAVLLMSIAEIGVQGNPFNEKVLDRIRSLKTMWPEGKIVADGGINEQNLASLKEAGLDRACIGSGIFKADDPGSKTQGAAEYGIIEEEMPNKFGYNSIQLQEKANDIRQDIIKMLLEAGSGHSAVL